MSVRHCMGQSEVTALKHDQLRDILRAHLHIVMAIKNKWSHVSSDYCYFETNAGRGIYEDGTKGSPVIFLEEAKQASANYLCQFIDKSSRNCKRLSAHVDDKCIIAHGRYQDVIANTSVFSKNSYGLLFCDPNGSFDELALAKFAAMFPHVDILINVNGNAIKRGSRRFGTSRIKEKLSAIGKEHWSIRGPRSKWQFSFALGTGWGDLIKKFQKHDMYDINSMIGQSYLDRLERTNAERVQDVQGVLDAPALSIGEASRVAACGR